MPGLTAFLLRSLQFEVHIRAHRFRFEATQNATPENITGFETKNDAIRWVRNESEAWLNARRRAANQIASC
jgi:hypothetical protein